MAREGACLMAWYRCRGCGRRKGRGRQREWERKCISPLMDLALLWHPEPGPQKKHNAPPSSVARICISLIIRRSPNLLTLSHLITTTNGRLTSGSRAISLGSHQQQQQQKTLTVGAGGCGRPTFSPTAPSPRLAAVVLPPSLPGFPDFASKRRGRVGFLLSAPFLSAGPSKNIKWEQMKHRNGDQFTERCN